MAFELEAPPVRSVVTVLNTDPRTREVEDTHVLTLEWVQWFFGLMQLLRKMPRVLEHVTLTAEAQIDWTRIPLPIEATGLYRLSYGVRVTRPAGTSSSVQPYLGWIDGGVWCVYTQPAVTGNTTATHQTGSVLANVDASALLYYAVVYSSVGTPAMQYTLDIAVEGVVRK